jgi:hypothetical protein
MNQDENILFIMEVRKFVKIIFAKRGACVIPSAHFFMAEDNFTETRNTQYGQILLERSSGF